MPNKPTVEARVIAQTNARRLIQELLDSGLSHEQVCVGMGEFLCGPHPSVQSLHRWKSETSMPSRVNGAALAMLHAKNIKEEE